MQLLGIDVGTTNTKVVVVDSGRILATAAAPTPAGGAELIAVTGRLIAEVTREHRPGGVGIASMAETGIPLDADDEPIGDLVRWHPTRATRHADRLARDLGRAELFAATGVRPSGKVPLAVWAQLREQEPRRWARMRRWAGAADLIALALTGRLVTDHTLAGRTMAYRLPGPGAPTATSFDEALLAVVGLRPYQLPDVAAPGETAGRVRVGAPGGLAPGTPVVVAGHDHQVGAWAAGVREAGQVANSLGTAESVIRILDRRPEPAAVAAEGMSLVRTPGGHEALVAGSPAAGGMLGWLADQLGQPGLAGPGGPGGLAGPRGSVDEVGPLDRMGPEAAEAALAIAANRGRTPEAPFVLPYLHGRQAPQPDPQARAVVVGDVADDGDLACAVVDGLALHARWLTTAQAELAGTASTAGPVVLGAGGRVDSAWLHAKQAAGPGRLRIVEASEPVAAGAALLAGYRAGLAGPLTLPSAPAPRGPEAVYDQLFTRFRQATLPVQAGLPDTGQDRRTWC